MAVTQGSGIGQRHAVASMAAGSLPSAPSASTHGLIGVTELEAAAHTAGGTAEAAA